MNVGKGDITMSLFDTVDWTSGRAPSL